jgi:hypothetical protein
VRSRSSPDSDPAANRLSLSNLLLDGRIIVTITETPSFGAIDNFAFSVEVGRSEYG